MPELLIFAFDHSAATPPPSTAQLAALPKPFDLVTWQTDGWTWGDRELAHPWFRILVWPDAAAGDLETLLAPQRASGGTPGMPQYLGQYRAFHLDLGAGNENLPPGVAAWHADPSRAQAKFTIPRGHPMTVANSKRARAAVANPAFIGGAHAVIG
jgi:hypothetical protein